MLKFYVVFIYMFETNNQHSYNLMSNRIYLIFDSFFNYFTDTFLTLLLTRYCVQNKIKYL